MDIGSSRSQQKASSWNTSLTILVDVVKVTSVYTFAKNHPICMKVQDHMYFFQLTKQQ